MQAMASYIVVPSQLLARGEKIDVPLRPFLNSFHSECFQAVFRELPYHKTLPLQSRHKIPPSCARLLQAIRPEFEQKLDVRIFVQDAFCPPQGMQFVTLNIDLDQIDAFAGFEVIVEGYHFDCKG